ncbi:hypothetical protein Emed_002450 [Eimeria media]
MPSWGAAPAAAAHAAAAAAAAAVAAAAAGVCVTPPLAWRPRAAAAPAAAAAAAAAAAVEAWHLRLLPLVEPPPTEEDGLRVHKEQLASVPNALSGRDSVDVIVHGMDGIPTEIIQEKLAKYQQRADGKATRKRERANWAQVTMAPASLEHFILLAQQGQLPQFDGVPPTPVIPGLAATLPSFGAPGAPPQPPALPVPPNLQGLLSQATGVPLPGMPGAPPPQQGGFGFPMGPPSTQPLMPPQQQGMMMGQGAVPPGLASGSAPGAPAPPAGGAPPAAAPLAAGGPAQGRGGPNSMVPPGPPPVFSTPALPSNTKLMYPDDTMSVEERRASEIRRY